MELGAYSGGIKIYCKGIDSAELIYSYGEVSLLVTLNEIDHHELARELSECDDGFIDALFAAVYRMQKRDKVWEA